MALVTVPVAGYDFATPFSYQRSLRWSGSVASRKPLPFRRIERVSPLSRGGLLGWQCAFCAFRAVAVDPKVLVIAKAAHHCAGMDKVGKKPVQSVREGVLGWPFS